jgi:hypothetical protein
MMKRIQLARPRLRTGWYTHGHYGGKSYTRGPRDSESDARNSGLQMFPSNADWSVFELPTRDLSRAKRMLADRELSSGSTLEQATQRKFTKIAPLEQR